MDQQGNMKPMKLKRPRRLNLNAPLLSTRRLGSSIVEEISCSSNPQAKSQITSERIPFSWEKSPGKPKDEPKSRSAMDEDITPRLKLPPSRWQPRKEPVEPDVDDEDDNVDNNKNPKDVFSDAMDVQSLSEALDIVQKSEEAQSDHKNDGLRLKLEECRGNASPNYIIKRFLPDATALAASSALQFSRNIDKKVVCGSYYSEAYFSAGAARKSRADSPKACGLENLLPWRIKHKLCAIESPVLQCSTNVQKHQRSSRQKHCSSAGNSCVNNVEDYV